jgi:hypothetical protein
MIGLNLQSPESKWWGESEKLRAQLSGPARQLYRGCGYDIDAPRDTALKQRI